MKGQIVTIKLVTVTGPSCAGKTTLTRRLLDTGHFTEIVSFTTREPRKGEVDGVDYYFESREWINNYANSGRIAEMTEFKGNYYGIDKQEILDKIKSGKLPISVVEPHGLKQLRELFEDNLFAIYVDAPLESLYERFLERFAKDGGDPKYYAKRLVGIQEEQGSWRDGNYDFSIDHFDKENERSMVDSLVRILVTEREHSGTGV